MEDFQPKVLTFGKMIFTGKNSKEEIPAATTAHRPTIQTLH